MKTMASTFEELYDGVDWNRDAVVKAQRAKAEARAMKTHRLVTPDNLLSRPVAPSFVAEFEQLHNCRLPQEYRSFLTQVGDGGDGPGLHLRRLGAPFEDTVDWPEGQIHGGAGEPNLRLDRAFPHKTAQLPDLDFLSALDADIFPDHLIVEPDDDTPVGYPGALFLFDHGAAAWDLLIVTGECAGQVWADRVADGEGCVPVVSDGTRIGFASHYCSWLLSDEAW